MLSQFFLLSPRGDTIVNRDFRGDVAKGIPEIFFRKVKFWNGGAPPVLDINGITCVFLKRNTLFFVVTTIHNISPNSTIELLLRIVSIIKDFCGVLSEENIRRNFVLIYEILDEILDFGYVQSTNTEILRQRVFNEAVTAENAPTLLGATLPSFSSTTPKSLPSSAANRPVGNSSNEAFSGGRKNEIFVDVLEEISVIMTAKGHVINASIDGSIKIKSYIQGNPALKISLNEDIVVRSRNEKTTNSLAATVLEDCNFHPCIDLRDFDKWKILSFIPPEGEFTLMNYRLTGDFWLPFLIFPSIEQISPKQLEIIVKIQAEIPETNCGGNLKVSFPLPKNTSFAVCDVLPNGIGQNADYISNEGKIVWTMKKIQGGKEHLLRCRVTLNTDALPSTFTELVSLNMQFELPMYSASNLQVRYLRLVDATKSDNPFRWVRYITESSSYVCRFS